MTAPELASTAAVLAALTIAAIVMPRPKPEPPAEEQRPPVEIVIIESTDGRPAAQRAEPLPERPANDIQSPQAQKSLDNIETKLESIAARVRNIEAKVDAPVKK